MFNSTRIANLEDKISQIEEEIDIMYAYMETTLETLESKKIKKVAKPIKKITKNK